MMNEYPKHFEFLKDYERHGYYWTLRSESKSDRPREVPRLDSRPRGNDDKTTSGDWIPDQVRNDREEKNGVALKNHCVHYGAFSFIKPDICDACGLVFGGIKETSPQKRKKRRGKKAKGKQPTFEQTNFDDFLKPKETTPPPEESRRRNMSFEQFEATKRKLNFLNGEYLVKLFEPSASGARLKELETEIETLRAQLWDNIHLAFLFQPEKERL